MSRHNVYRDERVHVMAGKCATCIFRPGNLMHLRAGRVEEMVSEAIADESAIVCHKTLGTDANAICRGYWDAHRRHVSRLVLAERLGVVSLQ